MKKLTVLFVTLLVGLGLLVVSCEKQMTTQNTTTHQEAIGNKVGPPPSDVTCESYIGDFVWNDLNCDGIQDSGEPGIAGVTVTLKDLASGTVLATTTTDASGFYWFANLCFGDYRVEVTTPSGFTPSPVGVGSDITIDSNPNPSDVKLDIEKQKDVWVDFGFCSTGPGCGRMTGGGSVFRIDGARVTRGFEIHCDLSPPNNIEVNWPGNNKFHMTSLTAAVCTDDPNIHQEPPAAPFDTFTGDGVGKLNNVPGATIHFVFVDAGEPGKNDMASIQVRDVNGNLVLDVSGFINVGNLQAHSDDCD